MSTRTEKWPAGTPCWIDLTSTDPDGARAFYGGLFGWDLRVGPPETHGYTVAVKDGRSVAAINGMPAFEGMPSTWVTYLATDDIDATWAAATAAGANEIAAPFDVLTQGRMALLVDPAGALFGLWQAGAHTGVQAYGEDSTVVWNELLSRDDEAARVFYASVFGLEYTAVEMPIGYRYSTFDVGGQMRGAVGSVPPEMPAEMPSRWGVYFCADDVDAMAASAVRLGGSVVSPLTDTPYGRMGTVADPLGATFSLMTPNR